MNKHWIYEFTAARKLDGLNIPSSGGVYVISYLFNSKSYLLDYKELYIGEAENFAKRFEGGHDKYKCCKDNSNQATLHVSFHVDKEESSRQGKENA